MNFAGRNGNTALIVSASGGHASVVGLLLQPRGPLVARTMALIQAAVARRTAARASSARFRGLVKLAIELRRRRLRAAAHVPRLPRGVHYHIGHCVSLARQISGGCH